MTATLEMFRSHPAESGDVDLATLADCIDACFECAQTCTTCADACLSEDMVAELVRCIRLNEMCADVCDTTGRILSRAPGVEHEFVLDQLEACAAACRECAEECERHDHEHCRVCAESCRRCERSCESVLEALPAAA